ncbi:HIRAN domain-containing protein [Kutzneria kofuensis]|uniref:HIRAN domain-containing protein n=1 Tax=Kutzneria kofuensis TaxID=103725 RepID=A0A7W9KLN7_9PSEU|nr:HIRAN domain-containing protein [Kutzneria kofuensis]MBB5894872.1 hypothetical protein [Kutzneria kofuensis]
MWPFTRKRTASAPAGRREMSATVQRVVLQPRNSITSHAEAPRYSNISLAPVPLPATGHLRVVGESHYQQALHIVAHGQAAGNTEAQHIKVTAALIPEPENTWDRKAVRVDVVTGNRTVKVGYLPRDVAARYQPDLLALRKQGKLGTCAARIAGGGAKLYGIYLLLGTPADIGAATGTLDPIAKGTAGSVLLRNDWTCTVTKEEDHQQALSHYRPNSPTRPREVIASLDLCTIQGGKYKGESAIEVRLDGQRVGQLTYAMTQRYIDVVAPLLDRGLLVTCEATTLRSDKGIQVELRLPRAAK